MSRPDHLVEHHEKQKASTDRLVRSAVRLLKERGDRITIRAIRVATGEIHPTGRMIGEATITGNSRFKKIIEEEVGHSVGRRKPPCGLRSPSVKQDGWSACCHLANIERCRPLVAELIKRSLLCEGRMPTPQEVCEKMGYVATSKNVSRYRLLWEEFLISDLFEIYNSGEVTLGDFLRIMQRTPYYIPGSNIGRSKRILDVKLEWICDYIIERTSQPLTNQVINEMALGVRKKDLPSSNWTAVVSKYRTQKLASVLERLAAAEPADIVEGNDASVASLVDKARRLSVERYHLYDMFLSERSVYGLCDYLMNVRGIVPLYHEIRKYLTFLPVQHTVRYVKILKKWRRERGLSEQLRGSQNPLAPRTWEQLIPTLLDPVRSAPYSFLDPRVEIGRYTKPADDVALCIGKVPELIARSSLALAAINGSGSEADFPGFALHLIAIIRGANLSGLSDPRMEEAIKMVIVGDVKADYGNVKMSVHDGFNSMASKRATMDEDGGEQTDQDAWPAGRIRDFLRVYRAVSFAHQKFMKLLSRAESEAFAPFILLPLNDVVFWRSANLRGAVEQAAKRRRKGKTDALYPHFGYLRTIIEFRTNQVVRIRTVFHNLTYKAKAGQIEIPFKFQIVEEALPGSVAAEHHFILWTRRHVRSYRLKSREMFQNKCEVNSDDQFFLEYLGSTGLGNLYNAPELWFADLIRYNVCHKPSLHDGRTLELMHSYGICKTDYDRLAATIVNDRKLSSSLYELIHEVRGGGAEFRPVFFHPDGLYTICVFGRLATRLACVTGCRVNEMQQIFAGPRCLAKVDLPDLKRPVYAFTAIPKLRRELEPFYIDEKCLKFIAEAVSWTASQNSNCQMPKVKGAETLARHKRKENLPYVFQLNGRAMSRATIGSMSRFMIHGLQFKTRDGVVFQPGMHDLRHLTAAALRGMGVPLDVIARILKQRDIDVTDYYSEPTASQIITAMHGLRVAAIGIGSPEGVRTPLELQTMLTEANGRVGALTNVIGGVCSVAADCAAKFICVGCAGLVPDYRERQKIERIRHRQIEDANYYSAEGNLSEVRKAEKVIRDCDRLLEEMRLQAEADADACRPPIVKEGT